MFLQILNTEGQLYSFNIQSRALRWIQDLSSLDKVMTIAPGNSGSLYIVFPLKSIVVGLDVSTGNISWKQSIGPLSNEKTLPIVDSNGKGSILFLYNPDHIYVLIIYSFKRIHSAHCNSVFRYYSRKFCSFLHVFLPVDPNFSYSSIIKPYLCHPAPSMVDKNQGTFSLFFSLMFFACSFPPLSSVVFWFSSIVYFASDTIILDRRFFCFL